MSRLSWRSGDLMRRNYCLFLVILALALVVRTAWLGTFPPGLWYDEGLKGVDAWRTLHGGGFLLVYPDVFPREPLFVWLLSLALWIGGPKVIVMRLTVVILGSLACALYFLMVSSVERRRGWAFAFVAALVLATMHWHAHFSRLVFRTNLVPLVSVLLVWALAGASRLSGLLGRGAIARAIAARGGTTASGIADPRIAARSAAAWAGVGALAGLGFYTYLSWWFFLPVIAVWFWALWPTANAAADGIAQDAENTRDRTGELETQKTPHPCPSPSKGEGKEIWRGEGGETSKEACHSARPHPETHENDSAFQSRVGPCPTTAHHKGDAQIGGAGPHPTKSLSPSMSVGEGEEIPGGEICRGAGKEIPETPKGEGGKILTGTSGEICRGEGEEIPREESRGISRGDTTPFPSDKRFRGDKRIGTSLARVMFFFLLGAILVILPLAIHYARFPEHLFGRPAAISTFGKGPEGLADGLRATGRNALFVLGMFSYKGDHVPKHNVPWTPVLDIAWSVLFYAGIVRAFLDVRGRGSRGRRALAWLAWLFFMSLPSVFSKTDSANMLRNLGATPAVAFFVASGWWWGWTSALRRGGERRIGWLPIAVTAMLLWGAFFQVYKLWVLHPRAEGVAQNFNVLHVELARLCESDPRGALLFVPTDFYTHKTFEFLTIGRADIRPLDPVALLSRSEGGARERAVDHRVLCTELSRRGPDDNGNLGILEARFPTGTVEKQMLLMGNRPFARIFRVPAASLLPRAEALREAERFKQAGFISER